MAWLLKLGKIPLPNLPLIDFKFFMLTLLAASSAVTTRSNRSTSPSSLTRTLRMTGLCEIHLCLSDSIPSSECVGLHFCLGIIVVVYIAGLVVILEGIKFHALN